MLQLFPIAHKYAFNTILNSMTASVELLLPTLIASKKVHRSMMRWLHLADSLQLDELKVKLMIRISEWSDDEVRKLLLDSSNLNRLQPSTLVQLLNSIVPMRLKSAHPLRLGF